MPQLDYGMSARARAMSVRARAVVAAMQVRLAQVGGLSAVSNDSLLSQRGAALQCEGQTGLQGALCFAPFLGSGIRSSLVAIFC